MNKHLYQCVLNWIPKKSRVLDLGSGDGTFLAKLITQKNIEAEGVEKDKDQLVSCLKKGITMYHGDILVGLDQYPDHSFDYVLLLGTFEQLIAPEKILKESFRVGKHVIVAFTNFAHWFNRITILFNGKSPQWQTEKWYEQANVQFFSVNDFRDFCNNPNKKITQMDFKAFTRYGEINFFPNWFAYQAVCLLRSKQ